jgi:iron(III) transport system substrate-binding protein
MTGIVFRISAGGPMSHRSMRTRPIAIGASLLTALLALSACGSSSTNGADGAESTYSKAVAAACEAGADEGTLNYWSATDPGDFDKEVAPFRAKYPDIKVNFTSVRPTDATQKIITETQARHKLDVDATSTDLPSAQPLFDQGRVRDVDWDALDIPSRLQVTYGGVGVYRTLRDFIGIGYNSQRTPASDLPTTWDQLVDSKYSGSVVVDPRAVYLSGLVVAWGEDKTMEWTKDLLKTSKPIIIQGATDSIQKVISGEAQITTSATTSAINAAKDTGAPIDISYLDIVPSQDKYGVILTGAPHPNAAACFLGWFGSAEGQAQQLKVEFKDNADEPANLGANSKLSVAVSPADQALLNKAGADISELLSQ